MIYYNEPWRQHNHDIITVFQVTFKFCLSGQRSAIQEGASLTCDWPLCLWQWNASLWLATLNEEQIVIGWQEVVYNQSTNWQTWISLTLNSL